MIINLLCNRSRILQVITSKLFTLIYKEIFLQFSTMDTRIVSHQ